MHGYAGKILWVNLTKKEIEAKPLTRDTAIGFLGGQCLAAKILFENVGLGVDPLSPMNKLIFSTGPLNGLAFPGCAKYFVVTKSPLTNLYGSATSGGFFGTELKLAGYDAVVIGGAAEEPIYLWVHDGITEIKDASNLWGKTTSKAEAAIRQDTGDSGVKVASIGPAGEHLVKYACIVNDQGHTAGRCGIGAVMGAKKLKAIAVRGKKMFEIADKEKLARLRTKVTRILLSDQQVKSRSKFGTPASILPLNYLGILPTKNFQSGVFDLAEKISGETIVNKILVSRRPCFACPVACDRVVNLSDGRKAAGPEYETLASYGSLCLNSNLEAIAEANDLSNECGLDTISTGCTIAWAMECYDKGIINEKDTGGIKLEWGNHEAIIEMVKRICNRDGIGAILAEGVKRASEIVGKHSDEFAMAVKGLEVAMHDPRGKTGVGLSYATANRGACHLQSEHDTGFEAQIYPELGIFETMDRFAIEGKPKLVVNTQNFRALLDSLIFCKLLTGTNGPIKLSGILEITSAVTGWNLEPKDLLSIGEKAVNLGRAFNVREGIRRRDDTLPSRFFKPLVEGLSKGNRFSRDDLERMLDEYYELRGWDKLTGIPNTRKLKAMKLLSVSEQLSSLSHASNQ